VLTIEGLHLDYILSYNLATFNHVLKEVEDVVILNVKVISRDRAHTLKFAAFLVALELGPAVKVAFMQEKQKKNFISFKYFLPRRPSGVEGLQFHVVYLLFLIAEDR